MYRKYMSVKKEKIVWFETRLVDFFQKAGREHLPWRKKRMTAYAVWVSEIMLQQTQVARVIGYYTKFLKRFPDVESLAQANWQTLLPYYDGLGYYARGRNMLQTAKKVVADYGGIFPRDKKLLETLPGIGPYTAAAIMSFAYDDNHLAWDTNVKRVLGRFFFGSKKNIVDTSVWDDVFIIPTKILNAALMDFGNALCVARPKCEACTLRTRCTFYREKGKNEMQDVRYEIQDKVHTKVDWKDARAYIFLHENHKKYFSANKKQYQPFVMPSGDTTRAGIKHYFLKKYGLWLSVRPPHKKILVRGKPILLINAQILSGVHIFIEYDRDQMASDLYKNKERVYYSTS
ncbi:MAG TPA: hypothetical protein VJH89_00870 [Patescibacteria group bacterium]|nr:hypothetical protein [Patescibacteria group bacterium]